MTKRTLYIILIIFVIIFSFLGGVLLTKHTLNRKTDTITVQQNNEHSTENTAINSPTVPEYSKEVIDFLNSTKALVSATEAGINYQQYSDMVVQLKILSDSALETLTNDSLMQDKIKEIIEYYLVARGLWEVSILKPNARPSIKNGKIESYYAYRYPQIQRYLDAYPFLIEQATYYDDFVKSDVLSISVSCKILWQKAREEVYLLKTMIKK
jgi:hypothetical protein